MADERFWSSHLLEPKRNYRFKMWVGGIDRIHVKSAQKPTWEIGVAEHDYLNHKFKFPGKITFNDIEVTIVEEISNGAMDNLLNILHLSGYRWSRAGGAVINANDLNTISKRRAVEALSAGPNKGVLLAEIDSEGNEICHYTLHNAWISQVNPSEASYENEDLTDLSLTITYDYAKIDTNPAG